MTFFVCFDILLRILIVNNPIISFAILSNLKPQKCGGYFSFIVVVFLNFILFIRNTILLNSGLLLYADGGNDRDSGQDNNNDNNSGSEDEAETDAGQDNNRDVDSGLDEESESESEPDPVNYPAQETTDSEHDPVQDIQDDIDRVRRALNGESNDDLDDLIDEYPEFFPGNIPEEKSLKDLKKYLEDEQIAELQQQLNEEEPDTVEDQGQQQETVQDQEQEAETQESGGSSGPSNNGKHGRGDSMPSNDLEEQPKAKKSSKDDNDKGGPDSSGNSLGPSSNGPSENEGAGGSGSDSVASKIVLGLSGILSLLGDTLNNLPPF